MQPRVLVTGGAGFIGSHTCKALTQAGLTPVVLDNLVYGNRRAVKWGPLIVGDITDGAALDWVFAEHRPVAVMHFAAYAYVGESVTDPEKYYNNNVGGSLSLLSAMRRAGVGVLVFSSTCATYGEPKTMPIREDHPQHPVNPYGRTKLLIEQAMADYGRGYGLRSAALRYFNACGADPDGEIGERHDPETHLIPRTMMAATGGIPQLDLFGEDYDTPDGTCIRDYIHVVDLARAHVMALQHLLGGGESLRLNLGTGRGTSVREIISAVERISGRSVPVAVLPRREGDPPLLYADPAMATEVLGFRTKFNDIDEIMQTAWRFHTGGWK
ncbi:MAG: UDP-glucose 4-epimerase GalE [Proteobacteria bacterium]|nr:UDP-glucose 4-epimerase GalE [Pseudomonadota bacterium]